MDNIDRQIEEYYFGRQSEQCKGIVIKVHRHYGMDYAPRCKQQDFIVIMTTLLMMGVVLCLIARFAVYPMVKEKVLDFFAK